jgi:isoleucyl-tRNA synthetase
MRREVTAAIEGQRAAGVIGGSVQAAVRVVADPARAALLPAEDWQDVAIVSAFTLLVAEDGDALRVQVEKAAGGKCARCWKILPEVGSHAGHPGLCLRCADAVESGRAGRAA